MKRILPQAALLFLLTLSPSFARQEIIVEYLNDVKITDTNSGALADLSCRNVDKIVRLNISFEWNSDKTDEAVGSIVFSTNKDIQFLFPKKNLDWQSGVYHVNGYFIARSIYTQGIIANSFEKIDDATVMLNPNVTEIYPLNGCGPQQPVKASQPARSATLRLSNNRVYIGDVRDGKPNGQGSMTYQDGQNYVGGFLDGMRRGQATVTFADGRRFVGEYRDDMRNGPGTLTLANGERYVGQYQNGEKNGPGTSYRANGQVEFSGVWIVGKFVGPVSTKVQAVEKLVHSSIQDKSETAAQLLATLYAPYFHQLSSDDFERSLEPSLATLYQKAFAESKRREEEGPAGGDSLCNCQEPSLTDLRLSTTMINETRAIGVATFTVTERHVITTLQLVKINGHWLIEDLSNNENVPSLRKRLDYYIKTGRS